MKTILSPFPELSVQSQYPDSWHHLWDCRTCCCFPRSLRGAFWQPSSPFGTTEKISTVTVTFPQWWHVFQTVLCLLQILPVTCENSVTLNLSLMVTGIGLKRCSESHCYLEEASGSGHFPLAAPVTDVSFTFTSCHCFSPFGLSFQLLVRRASLLIYSMVRSLLPLDRLDMERQRVHVCPYLCVEGRSKGLGRYFSCSSE